MTEKEFKVQIMKTAEQWESGLRSRLQLDGNGISLFANPSFDSWLIGENWTAGAGDIVVDECGQTYWTAKPASRQTGSEAVWSLFRLNPFTKQIERVLDFEGCGKIEPQEMWINDDHLWILDRLEGRVLVFSRANLQIVFEFQIAEKLIDVDLDPRGMLYVLAEENGQFKIFRHSIPPIADADVFTLNWQKPVAVAVAPGGELYLLDAGLGRLIRYNPDTKKEEQLGEPSEELLKGLAPTAMQIDQRGVIFIATSNPAALHVFDGDGSYIGATSQTSNGTVWQGIELPPEITQIGGIGFDRNGGIYLATNRGLAKFTLSKNPVGQFGLFYSRTLDNGTPEGLWHRLGLHGRFPAKTNVEVYYHASGSTALRTAYDRVLSGGGSIEEKVAGIEALLSPLWNGPEVFKGSEAADAPSIPETPGIAPSDMSFEANKGRFLWLKLRLVTFDQKVRPSIRSARIYYPRLSYLRYLPPAYREDAVSAAFLERFLSIFETLFDGLDQQIDELFRYFNPSLAPPGFLPWLGSWIDVAFDEDLPTQSVRRLIKRAPALFARKGTVQSLTELLEIYTGKRVFVIEQMRGLKPMILGSEKLRLGSGTVLLGGGLKGFRLGDTSVVGHGGVRDRVSDPIEPFLPLTRRFTVLVDLDREEFLRRRATLGRIVAEQKPTHTSCELRLIADQTMVGKAVLGVSASLSDSQPYRVGITALGAASALPRDPRVLRLERGAAAGGPGRL